MGLTDSAIESARRQDDANRAAHEAWVIRCEDRDLEAARIWWNEHIAEPAEFWLAKRWSASDFRPTSHPYPSQLDHIIVTCDGWAFVVTDYRDASYSTLPATRCAFLIMGIESFGWPRLYKKQYGEGRITDMASMGRVLRSVREHPKVLADIEALNDEGYGLLMQDGRYDGR